MINSDLKKITAGVLIKWLLVLCVLQTSSAAAAENLFECRTGEIIGSDVSGFFTLEDSATARIDWFDKDESKLMSCDLSITGAKYNARAHSDDITFEFKKQACESNSEQSPIRLAVMNDGFLRVSNRTTGGYISHLLLFSNAQPLLCEIEKIDRKALEELTQNFNSDNNE